MSFKITVLADRPVIYPVALTLGILQAMAFDIGFDFPVPSLGALLSLLSLLGFLLILQHLHAKRALLFGYCFGFATFAWGLNWVYISMARFGGAPLVFAVLANIAVVAYLALYWLLAAYLICRLGGTPNRRLLLAAPVIALLEWVRSVLFIGFPWLSIGYSAVDSGLARQWAPLGGVFTVSFIMLLLMALLLIVFNLLIAEKGQSRRLYGTAVIFVALTCYSFFPNHTIITPMAADKTSLALVQGNMPVITEYDDARMTENLLKYTRLTDKLLTDHQDHPNVIIWPESAIPYFYFDSKDFLSMLHDSQRRQHFDLITGVPRVNLENETYYNSILLQRQADPSPQFYNKQHLLPFGEYLPFRGLFAFFRDYVDIPMSDFSRGQVVQAPFPAGGLLFSPSICFEAVFGDEIRQNASQAQVLLNISNDAWFGKSKAQSQHLNIARLRAVENNKYLLRATNNGITAVVSPTGEVEQSLPPFQDGILTAVVSANNRQTLYSRFGDAPWLLLFLLWIVLLQCYAYGCKKAAVGN